MFETFPTFSSIRFSVSGFMWRSLIHLDLRFAQEDKNGSICILLHADHQLNQHHLLKMLSLFHWMTICTWVHFWVFNSSPLIFLPVTVPIACSLYHGCSVVQLEVRDRDSMSSSFIVENSFSYPLFFVIPDEFGNCSF